MRHLRTALLVGTMILPISLLAGCQGSAKSRSSVDRTIKNAKTICDDLKKDFADGVLIKDMGGGTGKAREDSRMSMLGMLISSKIAVTIQKKQTDPAKAAKAMAKLTECQEFMGKEIMPKYEAAKKSNKPDDAKALAEPMNQLSKKIDELIDAAS